MDVLKKLANLLGKYPMKSIFIMIGIVILLVVGVKGIFMATGNDTLVKPSSDVYKDNEMLEVEFGGESVIVLYESDDVLTPDHLKHMKGLERALDTSDSIYSMMSPVTLVEEIAKKQSDTFESGIGDIIEGLNDMGKQLTEVSDELTANASKDPSMTLPDMEVSPPEMLDLELPELKGTELPELGELELPNLGALEIPALSLPTFDNIQILDMEGQMSGLNVALTKMTEAQNKLGAGTTNLVGGYDEFGVQLKELGDNLSELTEKMEDTPVRKQIQASSEQLNESSKKMIQLSTEMEQLPNIPDQTVAGLNELQKKLTEQVKEQEKLLQEQQQMQAKMQSEIKAKEKEIQEDMQEKQADQEEEIKKNMQEQQASQQKEMKKQMQEQQAIEQETMKQEIEKQKRKQKKIPQDELENQQAEQKLKMEQFQRDMNDKQAEQTDKLLTLSEGLSTMGEHLQTISENMETMQGYSDIMTPGLPSKQATLDNMLYEDGELRTLFEEVVVDENHMMMMVKFNGDTDDEEKSDVVNIIRTYLDKEQLDSLETIVSGKPVLDNGIMSSMQASIQKMMGLALLIMVVVLFFVFKVRWFLLPLVTVLIAVIGTVGLMGWVQIPITMVSMAVFPILIGLGIDYAIQFQNRYAEEMTEEDSHEEI